MFVMVKKEREGGREEGKKGKGVALDSWMMEAYSKRKVLNKQTNKCFLSQGSTLVLGMKLDLARLESTVVNNLGHISPAHVACWQVNFYYAYVTCSGSWKGLNRKHTSWYKSFQIFFLSHYTCSQFSFLLL